MKRSHSLAVPLILSLAGGGWRAQAGLEAWGEAPHRVGLSLRATFNVTASFNHLGGGPPRSDPGPATGGFDHFYDDGYNRVDSSGNEDGTTWFWGYDRASQADGAGIAMSSTAAQATGSLDEVTDDPQWGAELHYWRELGWNNSYSWGLVVGIGWQDLRFKEGATFTTDARRTTDHYSLFGQPPPAAPFRGEFDSQGGPVLSEIPDRQITTLSGGALTTGRYEFEAAAYTLRLGLLFETPFADWLNLQFGGGVLGSVIDGEFSFTEQTEVADLYSFSGQDGDRATDFAGGGYAELNLSARLAKGVYATVGAQYQMMTDFSQEVAGRQVEVDFRNAVVAVAGVSFAF